jgi:hypothetical protein
MLGALVPLLWVGGLLAVGVHVTRYVYKHHRGGVVSLPEPARTFGATAERLGLTLVSGNPNLDPLGESDWTAALFGSTGHTIRCIGERDGRPVELVHDIRRSYDRAGGHTNIRDCRLSVTVATAARLEIIPRHYAMPHHAMLAPTPTGDAATDDVLDVSAEDECLPSALVRELAPIVRLGGMHLLVDEGRASLIEDLGTGAIGRTGELALPCLMRLAARLEELERDGVPLVEITAPEGPAIPLNAMGLPDLRAILHRTEPTRGALGRLVDVMAPSAQSLTIVILGLLACAGMLGLTAREIASRPSVGATLMLFAAIGASVAITVIAARVARCRLVMREHGFEWRRAFAPDLAVRYVDTRRPFLTQRVGRRTNQVTEELEFNFAGDGYRIAGYLGLERLLSAMARVDQAPARNSR